MVVETSDAASATRTTVSARALQALLLSCISPPWVADVSGRRTAAEYELAAARARRALGLGGRWKLWRGWPRCLGRGQRVDDRDWCACGRAGSPWATMPVVAG